MPAKLRKESGVAVCFPPHSKNAALSFPAKLVMAERWRATHRDPSTSARDDGKGAFDNGQITASLVARFGGHRTPLQEKI